MTVLFSIVLQKNRLLIHGNIGPHTKMSEIDTWKIYEGGKKDKKKKKNAA